MLDDMTQQPGWRENVAALLASIRQTPEKRGLHNHLWHQLLACGCSPRDLHTLEQSYRDIETAEPAHLMACLDVYADVVQQTMHSYGTADIRDMVAALAVKQRSVHDVLRRQLRAIDGLLRSHDIPYWIVSGTLIGAIRHQGIIPWDGDVDIEMSEADLQRFFQLEDELREALGLSFTKRPLGHYKLANNFDVFADDNRLYTTQDGQNLFPFKHEIFPLREFAFYDFSLPGPNLAEQHLQREYGEDCLRTCKIWNFYLNNYFRDGFEADKYVLPLEEVNRILASVDEAMIAE